MVLRFILDLFLWHPCVLRRNVAPREQLLPEPEMKTDRLQKRLASKGLGTLLFMLYVNSYLHKTNKKMCCLAKRPVLPKDAVSAKVTWVQGWRNK